MIGGWRWLACALLALGAGAAGEAKEEALPEDELLEFLGGLDGLDEDWMDYLEKTDMGEVARARAPAAKAPAAEEMKKP